MSLPKVIGWGVVILIGYHILSAIMSQFIWGLVGLALWYCYLKYQESQRPPRR
jgi:hypothetical protein